MQDYWWCNKPYKDYLVLSTSEQLVFSDWLTPRTEWGLTGDSQGRFLPPEAPQWEAILLIDDDFDKMVRRMFEQLFQNAGMFGQIRNNQIRIQKPQNEPVTREENNAPHIEKIELGDRMLVLIDNFQENATPIAKIVGRKLNVTLNENLDDIPIELPFAVNLDESSILYHNGIIEINLIKATVIENSSDMTERILKNEFRG